MIGRLPSLMLVRLLVALLLATIGLQASQAFDTAARLTHGSAFNAAASEVALAPQRRTETTTVAATPLPPGLPHELTVASPPIVPILVARPEPRPDSTGPPVLPILDRQPAPRAPPIA
jgi:hypothetical protein